MGGDIWEAVLEQEVMIFWGVGEAVLAWSVSIFGRLF